MIVRSGKREFAQYRSCLPDKSLQTFMLEYLICPVEMVDAAALKRSHNAHFQLSVGFS